MDKYTEQQVEQIAPDNNLKAAKSLLKLTKWPVLGCSDRALWGSCQGSGKNPYSVMIDGQNFACKCSCPSRKFPCKHSLALLLLYSNFESNFTKTEVGQEPQDLIDWLDKRANRQEAKAAKDAAAASKPVDPKAQAKRQEARHQKILDGMEVLEQWLKDVIRTGLAKGLSGQYEISNGASDLAKRMVDAQAPGLSRRLYHLSDISMSQNVTEESYYPILKELSQLYMLIQSYRNIDNLPADWQLEIRRLVGFNDSREEILATPGVADEWLIFDDEVSTDERSKLTTHVYRAYGLKTNTYTYILVYVPKNVQQTEVYMVGEVYTGQMHFYPSLSTIKRALFVPSKPEHSSAYDLQFHPQAFPDFVELYKAKNQHFAANPFAFNFEGFVDNVRFATQGKGSKVTWSLVDASGHAIALTDPHDLDDKRKAFLASSLGNPFTAFVKVGQDCLDIRASVSSGQLCWYTPAN